MKRLFLLAVLFVFATLQSYSQTSAKKRTTDKEQIEHAIDLLFDGMRAGDSSMVHRAFFDEARLASGFTNKKNEAATDEIALQDFLDAIGTPHTEIWDERIDKPMIKIDGNMALAWVPYSFYLDGKLLHCGVNGFSLLRSSSGWKIMYCTDSRNTENCKERK